MTTPPARSRRLLQEVPANNSGFVQHACVDHRDVLLHRPRPGRETTHRGHRVGIRPGLRFGWFSTLRYNFYAGPCDQQLREVVLERAAPGVFGDQ